MHDYLCTLLKKTVVWSMKKSRPMLGEEHLVAQGVPALEMHSINQGLFFCPYQSIIPDLTQSSMKSLAGNSINIPVAGALIAFLLATSMRTTELQLGMQVSSCLLPDDDLDVVAHDALELETSAVPSAKKLGSPKRPRRML
jgi:hypothetical protein